MYNIFLERTVKQATKSLRELLGSFSPGFNSALSRFKTGTLTFWTPEFALNYL